MSRIKTSRSRTLAASEPRPPLLALAILGLSLIGWLAFICAGRASAEVIFSTFADTPYGSSEVSAFQDAMADHNTYSPSAFLVHLGDINAGSESCQESRYQLVANTLLSSEVPAFIVPGDNEWTDCSNPSQGWAWWEEHLMGIHEEFCFQPNVETQGSRPENFAFVLDNVLFIGLNYVSGSPSSVTQASADWVDDQYASHGSGRRALVFMAQKEPSGALLSSVTDAISDFGGPALYIHGNGHSWKHSPGWFGPSNGLRVQTPRTNDSNPPVQVTVTNGGDFDFDLDPFDGASPINRGPCGSPGEPELSIDDVFVNEGQTAVFTVALSGGDGSQVTVDYDTADDTAEAPGDYAAKSGNLSFSGSTTERTISVTVEQDTEQETSEAFFVDLSGASGASISKSQGAAVIMDDDTPPAMFDLTVTVQGTGSVALNPSGGTYQEGTVVTLTASAGSGYEFGGWSQDLSGSSNPNTISMDADQDVTATFTLIPPGQYTLDVTVSGSGSVDLDPAGGVYDEGTTVTVTPNAAPGFEFVGWSGDLSGSTVPETLDMDADRDVTAIFAELPAGNTIVFSPSHDAHVRSTAPTSNFGSDTVVRVKSDSHVYEGYLKFDVAGTTTVPAPVRHR
jgi:hypothetical protein